MVFFLFDLLFDFIFAQMFLFAESGSISTSSTVETLRFKRLEFFEIEPVLRLLVRRSFTARFFFLEEIIELPID
jgi:hypothetical protein